jgi:catechol 2,3-dioxygenase-like lactoylglutathione lyase family enzyme
VSDLARSIRFYQDTFGFFVISQRHSGNARVYLQAAWTVQPEKASTVNRSASFLYGSGIHFEQRVKEFIRQL